MDTNTAYQNYMASIQNYQIPQSRKEYQAPFARQFEAIYDKAQNANIDLSNAKEFLASLSQSELRTLQKYSGLADAVDVGALSAEGAYNLLMHDNEQFDFNNDGTAEVGAAKRGLAVPINMPQEVKDAYIDAMNSLSGSDRMTAMILTFDTARLNSVINNTPYNPVKMDYEYLKNQVESRLNPTNGAYTSEEAKASISRFWDAFNASYNGDKTQSQSSQSQDDSVAKFLHDLRTKGAAKFLADLNKEKIDKLVEEYKQKLMDESGDSPEELQKIEKLVEEFKKKLLEEMKEKMEEDSKNKKNAMPMRADTLVQMILETQQKKKNPLEELLQR